jgi:hypothetical protein
MKKLAQRSETSPPDLERLATDALAALRAHTRAWQRMIDPERRTEGFKDIFAVPEAALVARDAIRALTLGFAECQRLGVLALPDVRRRVEALLRQIEKEPSPGETWAPKRSKGGAR